MVNTRPFAMSATIIFLLCVILILHGFAIINCAAASKSLNYMGIANSRHFYATLDLQDQRVPRIAVNHRAHIPSTAEWTDEHWKDFNNFTKALEGALKAAFRINLVDTCACPGNFFCHMTFFAVKEGEAYAKENMSSHWHLIPRLPHKITITNRATGEQHIFEDPAYGKWYMLDNHNMRAKYYRSTSLSMMHIIIKDIQNHLDSSFLPHVEHKKLKSSL